MASSPTDWGKYAKGITTPLGLITVCIACDTAILLKIFPITKDECADMNLIGAGVFTSIFVVLIALFMYLIIFKIENLMLDKNDWMRLWGAAPELGSKSTPLRKKPSKNIPKPETNA